jgi:small subunit ribosomal protein S17
MADEEKNDQTEETQDAPAGTDGEAVGQTPAEEPAAEEAPAEEVPAEEPVAEDAPAKKPAPAGDADKGEPVEALSPKQARKQARSTHVEDRPERSPEERRSQRQAARTEKAKQRRAYRLSSRERAKARRAAQPAPEAPPPVERPHGRAKVRQGIVVSDRADKTITVRVDIARRHRRYDKVIRSSSTLHAHDESNDANIGDTVKVVESRPLSRTKRWRLVEVLERAK